MKARRYGYSRADGWRQGNSLLEMLIVFPILFTLSFGVADYSYFLYLKNTFQGAAHAGARAAIPYSATNSSVTSVVSNMLTAAGIASGNYTLTTNPSSVSGLSGGTAVTVTITATWGTVGTHILSPSLGGMATSKVIKGVAVMQRESH